MKNILVIGECFDDKFCFFDVTRLCPEGPFPVLVPKYETHNKGGAGNVVSNLYSLSNKDINVYSWHQKEEISKTRLVCERTNHHFARIDKGDKDIKHKLVTLEQFFVFCDERGLNPQKLHAVIFSDYGKGLLTKEFIESLSKYCSNNKIPTFLDTKFILGDWSKEIDFVKINELEYNNNLAASFNPAIFCKNLLVTFGKNGAKWINKNLDFPLENQVEVIESSGLGDIFLSTLVIHFLETRNIEDGIKKANRVCSFKATKKGIFPVDRKSIE
jgi:bifunctional ADP-heptose synthase (sugar kinase/adenylyltransferase)